MASPSTIAAEIPIPPPAELLGFADLDGWMADDHAAALATFRVTADTLDPAWHDVIQAAASVEDTPDAARRFFEDRFHPVRIGTPPALFTGYFEPQLNGSLVPDDRYAWPLYTLPPDMNDGNHRYSRAEIETGALGGRGLELVWLDDPVEAYFLHIQGSGRVQLPDGRVMRVGYAGQNGHSYHSIGQELQRRGIPAEKITAQYIRTLLRTEQGAALMNLNPSYVFFRELDLPADQGPLGTLRRPLTAMRSLAVDPAFTPLGAPVWLAKDGAAPLRRLMIAQDTGGAIKGPQRADIFFGTGDLAGDLAGTVKDPGLMVVLLPKAQALARIQGVA